MRFEQRQARDRHRADGRHVDGALEIDRGLLADHLQAPRDLHVQDVSRAEAIVRPGVAPRSDGRRRGGTARIRPPAEAEAEAERRSVGGN